MKKYGDISSREYLQAYKLSHAHRRVFPLSLFPGSSSESPHSLLKIPSFEGSQKIYKKLQKKTLKPLKSDKKPKTDKKLPELKFTNLKKYGDDKGFIRRSRDLSKDFCENFKIREGRKRNMKSFDGRSLLGVPNYSQGRKKKSIAEMLEEIKLVPNVRRISSSKITHPSANFAEILDKIKDLVLDPLRQELGDCI